LINSIAEYYEYAGLVTTGTPQHTCSHTCKAWEARGVHWQLTSLHLPN